MWQTGRMNNRRFVTVANGLKISTLADGRKRVTAHSTGSLFHIRKKGVRVLSMGKFQNRKTTVDGITFDSAKEANRYAELRLLQRAGKIFELQRQVPFVLIPKQERNGKVVERAVVYKADFVYREGDEEIVEDVKSPATRTKEYIIKRKLLLWQYGIRIREV